MLLPESIQIGTIDYCNRKCPWCPESTMDKTPDLLMKQEVFDKILSDLKDHGYTGRIHLYLMGEPLCDPRIHDLIRQARAMFPANVIFISTNGDLLKSVDDVKSLFDAGLTWMAISDYDGQERFQEYARQVPELMVTPLSKLEHTFYNRAGYINVACEAPFSFCEWVVQKAYVNYRGDVILCCSDYYYEHIFGNVMDAPFGEIYNSREYRAYKLAHISGRGHTLPLCNECNRITTGGLQ